MKNYKLFLIMIGAGSLLSCGTYGSVSTSQSAFQNGIYYSPNDNKTEYIAQKEKGNQLNQLQKTTYRAIGSNTNNNQIVETVYVGDTNQVDIQYNPNVDYSIVDDDESYEARLRKFDSPTYTVNITLSDYWDDSYYNPWWGSNYGWYRPNWITWGSGWYNPYWGYYYSWYGPRWGMSFGWDPWYYGWNDPWYYGWHDPWRYNYYGWYDPWYGGGYWGPGYNERPHRPGYYPAPDRDNRFRGQYYGRRESSPTYNPSSGRGGQTYDKTNISPQGSMTRRNPNMNAIRGNMAQNNNSYIQNGQNGQNSNGNSYTGTSNRRPGQNTNTVKPGYGNNTGNTGNNGSSISNGNNSGNNGNYYRGGQQVGSSSTSSTYNGARYNQSDRVIETQQNTNYSRGNSSYNNTNRSRSTYQQGSSRTSNNAPAMYRRAPSQNSNTSYSVGNNSNSSGNYRSNTQSTGYSRQSYSRSSSTTTNSSSNYGSYSRSSGSSTQSSGSSSSHSSGSGGGSNYRR